MITVRGKRHLIFRLFLWVYLFWAVPASADRKPVIEEVIVTATKRASSLQDTAGSISALTADDMAFREVNDMGDLRTQIPNMNYSEIAGSPLISIRGIGQSLETGVGDQAVASHIDGVYLARPGAVSVGTIDLERVEVLRGPQGTLYGRNATGGVINNIQAKPSHELTFGANVAVASFGRKRTAAHLSGPVVSDWLLGRIAVGRQRYTGEGKNIETGERVGDSLVDNYRMALSLQPSDRLVFDVSLFKQHYDGRGPWNVVLNRPVDLLGNPVPEDNFTNEKNRTRSDIEPSTERITEGSILTIDWDAEWISIKSISGYIDHLHEQRYGPDETSQFIFDTQRLEYSTSRSQEFNFIGTAFDRVDWLVGLYYFEDDGSLSLPTFANIDLVSLPLLGSVNAVAFLTQYEDEFNKAYAGFVDAVWHIAEQLRLNVGVRSGTEIKEVAQTYSAVLQTPTNDVPVDPGCDNARFEKKARSTDPKFTVEWNPGSDSMVYFQYQTAFKSGGFNISSCNDQYEPEEIKSVELGFRSSWLDNSLTLNVTAFDYSYENFQVFQINGLSADIKNAATASSRGAEIEVAYNATEFFSIDFIGSWLKAEFDEYFDQDGFKNTALLVEESNAPVEDLSGNALVRTPNYTYTLGLNFRWPAANLGLGEMRFRLENYGTDEFYFRPFNNPEDRQGAYRLTNAFFGVTSKSERVSAKIFVKNLFDEDYITAIFPIPNVKLYSGTYGESRTIGAEVSYQY